MFNAVTAAGPGRLPGRARRGRLLGRDPRKGRIILLGRYPQAEHWRAELATVLLLGLVVASCMRWFWKPWLVLLWAAVLAAFFTLMSGGVLGLTKVTTDQWGGLPLTVMLTVISMTLPFRSPCWWRWGGAPTCRPSARCASSTSS
jgi:general L-amino acid transport system permease protein